MVIQISHQFQDWEQHLPLVLWAYQTAVQESTRSQRQHQLLAHLTDLVLQAMVDGEHRGI